MGHEIVGLKIGASQLSAARVSLNGSARLLQVASAPLLPGDLLRRRGAGRGGARRRRCAPSSSSTSCPSGRPRRRREQPDRRAHDRPRRDRGPEAARERGALPGPGGPPDPDRRGRPRLPGPVANRSAPTASRPRASCSSSPTAISSTVTSRPAGWLASAWWASISRPSRCCARCHPVRGARGRACERSALVAVSIGSERSTLAVSDGSQLRVHARARLGRHRTDRRASPASSSSSPTDAERAQALDSALDGNRDARRHRRRSRPRRRAKPLLLGLQASPASSSPRSSSTRGSPARSGSARSSSRAAPPSSPASPRRCSRWSASPCASATRWSNLATDRKAGAGGSDPSFAIPIGLGMGS